MRLIVAGASGFIGRNVLLRAPREWNVIAVYHRSVDLPDFAVRHGLQNVQPVRCDLTSPDEARRLGELAGKCDAAIYLAANGDPTRSVENPLWDLESNTVSLLNFLEACPVGHLVYLSSGAVYDGLVGAVTPATPVHPRLPYAISKLASEQYIRFYAERRGRPAAYTIVRLFGAYGPHEPPRKITTRLVQTLAIERRREFAVRGDGRNLIDFMHIDDAVDGLLRIVQAPKGSRVVDVAAGRPITVNAVVEAAAKILGVSIEIVCSGEAAEYIEFYSADPTARKVWGIAPKIGFEDGFARLAAFLSPGGR